MSNIQGLQNALFKENNLRFAANLNYAEILKEPLTQWQSQVIDGAEYWFEGETPTPDSIRAKIYPTGHQVFYNSAGRRFLMTDPAGHVLHEAEWAIDPQSGDYRLAHARMQLDCGQWVGIKPRAKRFSTHIDLKGQAGWEKMTLDDLRRGASQVWKVPFSEVKYFYRDENFISTGKGEYDVILLKDGLYVLLDGTFDKTLFISFMFGVNWERLDLIPVVELFQSTLPGSGGAVFEFIWGLYEDQSRKTPLPPLRYRGLPTYPSKEAFNIFSAFFDPKGPDNLFDIFMDPDRSHEIEWTPRANPPWRYFEDQHHLCVTVQEGFLFKATVQNDPVALPYINTARGARAACSRYLEVAGDTLRLHDRGRTQEIPIKPEWNVTVRDLPTPAPEPQPFYWDHFFRDGTPEVDPVKMLFTVPFYPEGAEEIEESSLQPMALDQIFYYMENNEFIGGKLETIKRVLVHTFDTVLSGCVDCTHDREYIVLYSDSEFAVKNAQQLWSYAAGRNQLENLRHVAFLPESEHVESAYKEQYDMIFKWIPFLYHTDREACEGMLKAVADALNPGGLLFLQGPRPLLGLFEYYHLKPHNHDPIADMPFFRQHLKMCPENLVNPEATVFFAEKQS